MAIIINLDKILEREDMRSNELAKKIGITTANLSILKTGKAKAIRFSTLEAICEILNCQPGDILEYQDEK
ncbi:MAG: transcriptional regulator [Zunongwangia sp.]|jgi:putative transcriptional regulator|nr:helix-turn-helix transcriptional regulator [Zunongwangia profunda]MAC64005.1 transcriptional regulator [Flavobacteriaceae bacterium]MAO37662.1 transcriptional regulator [Zunongwangia sp.]MAG86582.1 transcriptional regulator [Flavobacteriaceae bacterium]MAS71659.1 transcriptional regulator [Zunongwangia sp.]MCC4226686.1 helix-turn-helix transcriptional regulator [Zunongwangia profunda]|tara:strand:- start:2015 stop:2224 length:210 start_codon:yes stop_codon:yes gene_type:complete